LCFSVLIPIILYSDYPKQDNFSLLISAFAVLLITGIIDDFNPIPVAYKFLGQFIPAIVIVTAIEAQGLVIPFVNDYVQLPYFFNYLFWIIVVVMSINAFNLIDGIDGLAIGLGIIGSLFYFRNFIHFEALELMIFSISLCFGLLGLLFYNLSDKFKVFIGDTGSLLIGGFLVFFALQSINYSEESEINSSFFMVIGSIFIPLVDLIRVTLVRIIHGDSPFKADRQHLHHLVLDLLKGNHLLTTAVILFTQLAIIYIFQLLSELPSMFLILVLISSVLIYFGVTYLLKNRRALLISD